MASRRRQTRETFIPLSHDPGQRAEADFGQIYVDFPDGRREVSVLVVTWSHSYAVFAIALPSERIEAILHGLVQAFEFFGCIPRELWWDNPRTVATSILRERQREINPKYSALVNLCNFEPLFCMPARGNEKPHVENRVKTLKQRWATPVPCVQNLQELNEQLRSQCEAERDRTVGKRSQPIGALFDTEREQALPLPAHAFDAFIREARQVDKYQTVSIDKNRYSVPRQYAFSSVAVKGYVDRVEIIVADMMIAQHQRSYGQDEQVLDPISSQANRQRHRLPRRRSDCA